jgi:hypothetical protein
MYPFVSRRCNPTLADKHYSRQSLSPDVVVVKRQEHLPQQQSKNNDINRSTSDDAVPTTTNKVMKLSNGGWDTFTYHSDDSTVTATSEGVASEASREETLERMVGALENELIHEKILRRLSKMDLLIPCGHKFLVERDREDRILTIMCRELLTVGYMDIKNKMDKGEVPLGKVVSVNVKKVKVGPVVEFITPDDKLEGLLCANQKAILLVTRWKTAEDFIRSWNEFFGDDCDDDSSYRTIVLREVYSSVDHGYDDKYRAETEYRQLNSISIERMWDKAEERVEALRRIDLLKKELLSEVRKTIVVGAGGTGGLKRNARELGGGGNKNDHCCAGNIKRRFF